LNEYLCTKLIQLDKRWRIGAVSYLNTRPLLLGIEKAGLLPEVDLYKAYPAQIAQDLLEGKLDIGLVPVAVIPLLKEAHLVSKYCIGAEGDVASVCIFSKVPMAQIEKVYLDYQSRTSVQLARILLANYWGKEVIFLQAQEGYIEEIGGTTAGVIIGDRALVARDQFPYIYDLAGAWVKHTGFPFVFATWVANKPIPTEFIFAFDKAIAYGLSHLEEVIADIPVSAQSYNLYQYYTENISYSFTAEKKEGMKLFLELSNQLTR
jgi:chorismate dehydratase